MIISSWFFCYLYIYYYYYLFTTMTTDPIEHATILDYVITLFTISLTITELDNILHLTLTCVMLLYWLIRAYEIISKKLLLKRVVK